MPSGKFLNYYLNLERTLALGRFLTSVITMHYTITTINRKILPWKILPYNIPCTIFHNFLREELHIFGYSGWSGQWGLPILFGDSDLETEHYNYLLSQTCFLEIDPSGETCL